MKIAQPNQLALGQFSQLTVDDNEAEGARSKRSDRRQLNTVFRFIPAAISFAHALAEIISSDLMRCMGALGHIWVGSFLSLPNFFTLSPLSNSFSIFSKSGLFKFVLKTSVCFNTFLVNLRVP